MFVGARVSPFIGEIFNSATLRKSVKRSGEAYGKRGARKGE